MGYREWRERQLARVDAMQARADERVVKAEQRAVEARTDAEDQRVERADDAALEWFRARARALREDHDDLVARAAVVGVPLPDPPRSVRLPAVEVSHRAGLLGVFVPKGVSARRVVTSGGVEGVDEYEHWRDRIVLAEVAAGRFGAR